MESDTRDPHFGLLMIESPLYSLVCGIYYYVCVCMLIIVFDFCNPASNMNKHMRA